MVDRSWVPRPCPRMPLWLFTYGRAIRSGQGSALIRIVTTGERVLTGGTFLTENFPAC